MAIKLTRNEQLCFYGLVKWPSLNDKELSAKLNIKRSTITSIRKKLKKNNIYSSYKIPNFELLGCELLTICYNGGNGISFIKKDKNSVIKKALKIPEVVYSIYSDNRYFNIFVSKNITELKKIVDITKFRDKAYSLYGTDKNLIYFPFEISKLIRLFDYAPLIKYSFKINIKGKNIEQKEEKQSKIKLTDKEKIVLYALVKYRDLNDTEIEEKIQIPRVTISRIRNILIKQGFLKCANVPNINKLYIFEFLVLTCGKIGAKFSYKAILDLTKKSPFTTTIILSEAEFCLIEIFKNYTEYQTKQSKHIRFNKNFLGKELSTLIFPIQNINQKLDFAPLTKKILGLNVGF